MTFTLTFSWWHIPTIITVLGVLWAFFWPADRGGVLGGVTTIMMLIPALFVAMIAWIIAGVLK